MKIFSERVFFVNVKCALVILALMLVGQQAAALAILLGEPANGGKILEQRCTACHVKMFGDDGSSVYTRDDHKIKTIEGLTGQVSICNVQTQNGELNADQLDDITAYLNEMFYKYDD